VMHDIVFIVVQNHEGDMSTDTDSDSSASEDELGLEKKALLKEVKKLKSKLKAQTKDLEKMKGLQKDIKRLASTNDELVQLNISLQKEVRDLKRERELKDKSSRKRCREENVQLKVGSSFGVVYTLSFFLCHNLLYLTVLQPSTSEESTGSVRAKQVSN